MKRRSRGNFMGGIVIDPNPKKHNVLIDHHGNQLESLDNKVVIKMAQGDVSAPPNIAEILAIKEKRLKEIPEDELSGFDVSKVGKVPEENLVKPGDMVSTSDNSDATISSSTATHQSAPVGDKPNAKQIQAQIEEAENEVLRLKELKAKRVEEMRQELAELEG